MRIADLWEKRETSHNLATSKMKEIPVRDEIKDFKDMVVNDGGKPGSEVSFHALELFTKKKHHDVFSALKEEDPSVRLEWISRAWNTFMKKRLDHVLCYFLCCKLVCFVGNSFVSLCTYLLCRELICIHLHSFVLFCIYSLQICNVMYHVSFLK